MTIIVSRVRRKTDCSHTLRFVERPDRVTVYHEKNRRSVSPNKEAWLSVLMDWIKERHANVL